MNKFLENIRKNDTETNKKVLSAYVLKLNSFLRSELLENICDIIHENKYNSSQIESVLEPFDEEEDIDKVVIMICREFLTEKEKIKYIVQNSQNISDIIYMLTLLFDEKKSSNYQMIAENLLYCYDYDLTNPDIDSLLSNLEEYEGDSRDFDTSDIRCYLKNKRIFDRESYEKPYWVSLQEGENIGLLATVSLGNSEDGEEDVKFDKLINSYSSFFYQLLPQKEKYGEDSTMFSIEDLPENIKKSIQVFLNASTDSESSESGIKIGIIERVWGPKNSILGKDCSSGPEGKGPCRMLQCECLDLDEDENNEVYQNNGEISWFRGKCDSCRNYIPDLSHGLRFPHKDGGWSGCYCSFDCMTSDPPFPVCKEENILLGIMKTTIDKYGIMDRSSFC
tara:strand:- start:211 stop:1389 length:1179 start_codon:yes stop_codon:yes gene_type:complete